jgi:hypothetical protein
MKTKAEALANPEAGDRWRYESGEISTVTAYHGDTITDTLTWVDGSIRGPFTNSIEEWLFHAHQSEYLGNEGKL